MSGRLADVFGIIGELKVARVIDDYAIGGAMAVLFYAEPLRTYDLDVFVFLPAPPAGLVTLTPLYAWLKERGFEPDAEHVLIHGVPVQFLPVYNPLVEEGVRAAQALEYDEGTVVRVVRPEYLVALAVQTGGRKRREHVARLLEVEGFDQARLVDILTRHALIDIWMREWSQP